MPEAILWSWIWTDDPFLTLTKLYRGPLCRQFRFFLFECSVEPKKLVNELYKMKMRFKPILWHEHKIWKCFLCKICTNSLAIILSDFEHTTLTWEKYVFNVVVHVLIQTFSFCKTDSILESCSFSREDCTLDSKPAV